MKIAIVEIMPKGHFTLVESLAKIYLSDPDNQVTVYGKKEGEANLTAIRSSSFHYESTNFSENQIQTLKRIYNEPFDKVYIITLYTYLNIFAKFSYTIPTNLFIHNIENWFQKRSILVSFLRFFSDVWVRKINIKYALKVNFIYPRYFEQIRSKVLLSKGKFCVLNQVMMKNLAKYTAKENIEVIPFSTYNGEQSSNTSSKLRICLPGYVSKVRRDYLSVFEVMKKNAPFFKENFTLILLGGISVNEQGQEIYDAAQDLIKEGFDIITYNQDYINVSDFDKTLKQVDFILVNLHISLDKYNTYGVTKESGAQFSMIKYAVPGIIPDSYNSMEELKSSMLRFESYDAIYGLLKKCVDNKDYFAELKANALQNSLNFSPENIYKTQII